MGQRGPKPGQYRYRQVATGAACAKAAKPKFEMGAPTCPSWLSADAKKVWRKKVKELGDAGTLATVDGELLAAFCVASAHLAAVTKAIDTAGVYIERPTFNRNGKPTGHSVQLPNPLLKTQDALMGRVNQLAAALTIGPAARAKQGPASSEPEKPANRVTLLRDQIAAHRRGENPPSTGNRVLDIAARHQA